MPSIEPSTTIEKILSLPEFAPMRGQFVSSATDWFRGKGSRTLRDLQAEQPTWSAADMAYGLNRLLAVARRGKPYVLPLESGARLVALPADEPRHHTCCLLLAGGAYGAVCTMVEALPVAARLNELGVDCCCLNYHTATAQSMVCGLMPQPLDDVAAAVRHLMATQPGRPYALAGFSAGGHVCALWGTRHLGARSRDLPQPVALLLDYPLTSLAAIPAGPIKDYLLQGLFGTGHNSRHTEAYSVPAHVDAAYPPTWLERAADDTTVPQQDTRDMVAALEGAGVPHHLEAMASGGHGFGLGSHTPAKGWAERAWAWMTETVGEG